MKRSEYKSFRNFCNHDKIDVPRQTLQSYVTADGKVLKQPRDLLTSAKGRSHMSDQQQRRLVDYIKVRDRANRGLSPGDIVIQ